MFSASCRRSSQAVLPLVVMWVSAACDDSAVEPNPSANDTAGPVKEAMAPEQPAAPTPVAEPVDTTPPGERVEALTGSPVRIVWTRDTDNAPKNPWQYGDSQQLMTFDSRAPDGTRTRLEAISSYGKPLLSPDGKTIIYSNRGSQEIFRLDFAAGDPVKIAEGFALEFWNDPTTDRTWIYAGKVATGGRVTAAVDSLFRFPLDAPTEVESLLEAQAIAVDNFQLSRDGKAAGGLFPWPHGGLMRLEDGEWSRARRGCWASMCPDNSYVFWVFDGGHHVPSFYDAVGQESWDVVFDRAPGFKGAEVYHPRWSNRADLITLSGPYPKGVFANLGTGEIMLGKLSPDLRKVDSWVQVTDNNWPDGYADVWVAGGETFDSELVQRNSDALAGLAGDSAEWEKNRESFVFRWPDGSSEERIYDSVTRKMVSCSVSPTGNAVFGRGFSMQFNGFGAFKTEGFEDLIQHFCGDRNAFSFEAIIASDGDSDGQILCYGADADSPNVGLMQKDGELVLTFHVARPGEGSPLSHKMGRLTDGKLHHFFAKFGNGVIASYLDGKLIFATEAKGHLENWQAAPLLFGNSPAGDRPWTGSLRQVYLYDDYEIEHTIGERSSEQLALANQIVVPAPLKVRARLVESTPIPAADSIGAYRRALIGNTYEVEQVIEGKLEARRIAVFHWAILDRQPLAGATRKQEETFTLNLEPLAERPELKGERRFFDSEEFDLELYLDTGFP